MQAELWRNDKLVWFEICLLKELANPNTNLELAQRTTDPELEGTPTSKMRRRKEGRG